jgi:hypothetical protein
MPNSIRQQLDRMIGPTNVTPGLPNLQFPAGGAKRQAPVAEGLKGTKVPPSKKLKCNAVRSQYTEIDA